jgi:hypothetical protein
MYGFAAINKSTGDRCLATGNSLPYGRCGINTIIEDNCQSFSHVRPGNLVKDPRAFTIEFYCNIGFVTEITANSYPRVGKQFAG